MLCIAAAGAAGGAVAAAAVVSLPVLLLLPVLTRFIAAIAGAIGSGAAARCRCAISVLLLELPPLTPLPCCPFQTFGGSPVLHPPFVWQNCLHARTDK